MGEEADYVGSRSERDAYMGYLLRRNAELMRDLVQEREKAKLAGQRLGTLKSRLSKRLNLPSI